MKRLLDVTLALIGLLINLPLMALAAVLVKLSSPGPVLFRQKRVGLDFRSFEILKFRTMVVDAPKIGAALTVAEDPRITRAGWWLRMSKVDELPQLVNVLRGDMSLVGPRPEVEEYVTLFRRDYEHILSVRPGITDLASIRFRDEEQVLGATDDPAQVYVSRILPLKIQLAREYIERQSILFDLSILLRTFARIFLRGGSPDAPPVKVDARGGYSIHVRYAMDITIQLAVVALSNYVAFQLRFDNHVPPRDMLLFWRALPWLVVIRGLVFIPFRLYQGLWRYTTVYDLLGLLGGVATSSLLFFIVVRATIGRAYPQSVILMDPVLATTLLAGLRIMRRVLSEVLRPPEPGRRVLIYGAGDAGEQAVLQMQQNRGGYRPIGFIDDDPAKVGRRIHGVRVLGSRADARALITRLRPEEIVVAMPRAGADAIEDLVRLIRDLDVPIRTLPAWRDIGQRRVSTTELWRTVSAEMSATRPLPSDDPQMLQMLGGRRVMITGAGGSVGAELCRQILPFKPATLTVVDRHEGSLRALVDGRSRHRRHDRHETMTPVLADMADQPVAEATLRRFRPQVIFHAATFKDPVLARQNPGEIIHNNLRATRLLGEFSERYDVDRVVLMSDSGDGDQHDVIRTVQRLVEGLLVGSTASRTTYCSMRFGRAFDVHGRLAARIGEQIQCGEPVVVSSDESTFDGFLADLVALSLQAAARSEGPGVYLIDPGAPLALTELVQRAARVAGVDPGLDVRIAVPDAHAVPLRSEPAHTGSSPLDAQLVSKVQMSPRDPHELKRTIEALERAALADSHESVLELISKMRGTSAHHVSTVSTGPAPGLAAVVADERRNPPCPRCASLDNHRSKRRGWRERLGVGMGNRRPYRCANCGWRGLLEPIEVAPAPASPAPAVDLQALDAVTDLSSLSVHTKMPPRGRQ